MEGLSRDGSAVARTEAGARGEGAGEGVGEGDDGGGRGLEERRGWEARMRMSSTDENEQLDAEADVQRAVEAKEAAQVYIYTYVDVQSGVEAKDAAQAIPCRG